MMGTKSASMNNLRLLNLFRGSFAPHDGEEKHIADGGGLRQQHDKTVDADSKASSWRHALADRFDELFI